MLKKLHMTCIGICSLASSLPALAGPNWEVIDQERLDHAKVLQMTKKLPPNLALVGRRAKGHSKTACFRKRTGGTT